jgi:predicted MFS family arabinose efflux permease
LFGVAALYGLLKMANWSGVPSLIPSLVAPGELNTANAMESASFGIADVAGPAAAGVLIGLVGAESVLAFDAATYVVFLVCLLAVKVGSGPRSPEGVIRRTSLRPAFTFLRRTPAVLATTSMFMAFNVGEGMLLVLLPQFTRTVLGGGARQYGALLSIFALAALAGSLTVGAIEWRPSLGRSIAVAQSLAGLALLGLALRSRFVITAATLAFAGFFASPLTIWAQTIRMRLIPEELRGRIFGVLRTLMQATPPAGGALAGVLLAGPGIGLTVILMSAVMTLPGLVGVVAPALAEDRVSLGDASRVGHE